MSINPPNDCENGDPRDVTVEEQRPGFKRFKPKVAMKDSREVAHNARKKALANLLEPLLGDGAEAIVLLCWGKEHECSVVPVSISDSADETVIWREIKQAWRSRGGWWRRHICFPGVKCVDLIEVSLAGMNLRAHNSSRGAVGFVGMYTGKDLQNEKERLKHIIKNTEEQDYGCQYNLSTGQVECFATCVSEMIDVKCPEKARFEAQRQLENLETHQLMRLAFSNPELSSLNDFLRGEHVVYGHRSVSRKRITPRTLSDVKT
ncbi:hypothetical protein N7456_006816 [Penicillium angulare]|uniref:Uncharacterized protein n=1 Tax=Penicillium angulare TaxID=116970 RepID=A0A9W9FIH4_9EURO|nr:hypothetical protein N7456_006816 [Penicillium angulare]